MIVRLLTKVVEKLNFNCVRNPVVLIGALNEETAVGVFRKIEFERANKRGVLVFRPDYVVFLCAKAAFVVEIPNAFREIAFFKVRSEKGFRSVSAEHHRTAGARARLLRERERTAEEYGGDKRRQRKSHFIFLSN